MIILGIETSCDETAVALVRDDKEVLFHQISSQIAEHQLFGGVVPEVAARAHLQILPNLISQAFNQTNLSFKDLSGVAATCGPGLIGGVMVGALMGKALACVHNLPFLAVNHIAAHALTPRLTHEIAFPYLTLLMSGGHTLIALAKGPQDFEILGTTLDDAIGECIDKVARILGLGYPGGPALEILAQKGTLQKNLLPVPKKIFTENPQRFNFSFSGLKSAARRFIENGGIQCDQDRFDLAYTLQYAISQSLSLTLDAVLEYLRDKDMKLNGLVAAGGVAANGYFRQALEKIAQKNNLPFIVPPSSLCTDNGAMIAWAGVEKLKCGLIDGIDFKSRPQWPLDELRTDK